MTRGNQREEDRKKAQAKLAKSGGGKKDGETQASKNMANLNNADIMREKQRIAQAKKDGTYVDPKDEKP